MTRAPDTSTATSEGPDIVVDLAGDEYEASSNQELTFGRSADIVVDDNPYLHRVLGRLHASNGVWWLSNVGGAIPIRLDDVGGPSYVIVAPGTTVAISFSTSTITFEAGERNYELRVELLADTDTDTDTDDQAADGFDPEATISASQLPLNDEQRLLLIALAEPWLREHGDDQLATNRQIASRLGWTITKYNRKLDGLCKKYAAAGVSGLRGSSDLLARDRRLRLVEHALHAGVVAAGDLDLLDQPGAS